MLRSTFKITVLCLLLICFGCSDDKKSGDQGQGKKTEGTATLATAGSLAFTTEGLHLDSDPAPFSLSEVNAMSVSFPLCRTTQVFFSHEFSVEFNRNQCEDGLTRLSFEVLSISLSDSTIIDANTPTLYRGKLIELINTGFATTIKWSLPAPGDANEHYRVGLERKTTVEGQLALQQAPTTLLCGELIGSGRELNGDAFLVLELPVPSAQYNFTADQRFNSENITETKVKISIAYENFIHLKNEARADDFSTPSNYSIRASYQHTASTTTCHASLGITNANAAQLIEVETGVNEAYHDQNRSLPPVEAACGSVISQEWQNNDYVFTIATPFPSEKYGFYVQDYYDFARVPTTLATKGLLTYSLKRDVLSAMRPTAITEGVAKKAVNYTFSPKAGTNQYFTMCRIEFTVRDDYFMARDQVTQGVGSENSIQIQETMIDFPHCDLPTMTFLGDEFSATIVDSVCQPESRDEPYRWASVLLNNGTRLAKGDTSIIDDIAYSFIEDRLVYRQLSRSITDHTVMLPLLPTEVEAPRLPWININDPCDINGDGHVSALDLLVLNNIERSVPNGQAFYVDVSRLDRKRWGYEDSDAWFLYRDQLVYPDISGNGFISYIDLSRFRSTCPID